MRPCAFRKRIARCPGAISCTWLVVMACSRRGGPSRGCAALAHYRRSRPTAAAWRYRELLKYRPMRTTSTHERALFRHRAFSRPAVRNQHTHHMQREQHLIPTNACHRQARPSAHMKLAPVITSASTAATQPPSLHLSIASARKAPAPGAYGAIRCSLLTVQMIHDSARWHVAVQLLDFGDEVTRRPS